MVNQLQTMFVSIYISIFIGICLCENVCLNQDAVFTYYLLSISHASGSALGPEELKAIE